MTWDEEVTVGRGSAMTAYERDPYLTGQPMNFGSGYPAGINPDWIRDCQQHPAPGYLDIKPGRYLETAESYFRGLFTEDPAKGEPLVPVTVVPTCSLAFKIAAEALAAQRGCGDVIVAETSYDSHPLMLQRAGLRVVHAPREYPGGLVAPETIAEISRATRAIAVVLCSPDNPLGLVYPRGMLAQLIELCKERGLTLIADNCLAGIWPFGVSVPLASRLPGRDGLSYMLIGDTGKVVGLAGSKLGAVIHSPHWAGAVEAAASPLFLEHSQLDLALLHAVLSDARFPAYLRMLNDLVAGNHASLLAVLAGQLGQVVSGSYMVAGLAGPHLVEGLAGPARVNRPHAGPFCLVDTGADDEEFAAALRRETGMVVMPVSRITGRPDTRIRVALTRRREDVAHLGRALIAASAGNLAS